MDADAKRNTVLTIIAVSFLTLAAAFSRDRGALVPGEQIPPVDPIFTNTATARVSGAELYRTGGDTSGLECYLCHDRNKPVKLTLDADNKVVLPKEHEDLQMGHGKHNRNNNCFNCHDETNLELLQTRDGRELKLVESTPLCGSCHGPTYRDWEAGAHGRTSGYWKRDAGAIVRQDCVACHNPHSPAFPPRKPAPAPHSLREGLETASSHSNTH